mmetsp:Transcript_32513/g.105182  ORF Transcript_32513/g.105182 Transcript_32513/m.105182 type:complete len:748 (-) Transcript_32513:17-2260(-)
MLRGRILGTRRHGRRTVYALRTDHRVHVCGRHARCAPADHRKRLRHPLAAAVAVGGLLRCDASARRRARRAPRGARRAGGAARVALDSAGQRVARGGPLDRRRSPLLGLNALRHVLCVRVLGVVHGLARAERRARGQQRPRVRLCGARLVPASRVHGPACRQGPLLLLWPDRLDRTLRRLAAAAPLPRAAAPPRRRLAKAAHHACAAAGGAKGTARARPPPRRRATVGQDDARTRHPPCRERRSVRLQWHRVRRLPPPHGRRTMRAPFRAHPSARAVAPPVGGHKRRLSAAVLSNRAQAAGVARVRAVGHHLAESALLACDDARSRRAYDAPGGALLVPLNGRHHGGQLHGHLAFERGDHDGLGHHGDHRVQRGHLQPRPLLCRAARAAPLPLVPAHAHAAQDDLLPDLQHLCLRPRLPLPHVGRRLQHRLPAVLAVLGPRASCFRLHAHAARRAGAARDRRRRTLRLALVLDGRPRADEWPLRRPRRHPRHHRVCAAREAVRTPRACAACGDADRDERGVRARRRPVPALPLSAHPQGGLPHRDVLPSDSAAPPLRLGLHVRLASRRPVQPAARAQAAAAHHRPHHHPLRPLRPPARRGGPYVDGHLLLLQAGAARRAPPLLCFARRPLRLLHGALVRRDLAPAGAASGPALPAGRRRRFARRRRRDGVDRGVERERARWQDYVSRRRPERRRGSRRAPRPHRALRAAAHRDAAGVDAPRLAGQAPRYLSAAGPRVTRSQLCEFSL